MIRVLALLLLTTTLALARAGLPSNNPTLSAGGCSYTGPGDLEPGAVFFGGFRAYSSATAAAGAKAINIRRASDNATTDINLLCNGTLNGPAAATFCAATSCFVTEIYDQTGHGLDVFQSTAAFQATYTTNCNSLTGIYCASGNSHTIYFSTTNPTTLGQPDTWWNVGLSYTNTGANVPIGCSSGGGLGSQRIEAFGAGAHSGNSGTDLQGTVGVFSISDHMYVANGVSSIYDIDGSNFAGNSGTTNCSSVSDFIEVAYTSIGSMNYVEGAAWAGAKTNADYTILRTNSRAFWGY